MWWFGVGVSRVFLDDSTKFKKIIYFRFRIWPFWGTENFLGTDFRWFVKTKRLANLTICALRVVRCSSTKLVMNI